MKEVIIVECRQILFLFFRFGETLKVVNVFTMSSFSPEAMCFLMGDFASFVPTERSQKPFNALLFCQRSPWHSFKS